MSRVNSLRVPRASCVSLESKLKVNSCRKGFYRLSLYSFGSSIFRCTAVQKGKGVSKRSRFSFPEPVIRDVDDSKQPLPAEPLMGSRNDGDLVDL